ncbi:DMT family transporter [Pararhizobium mangrovi]|uniref:DMT family transporter n=1 Tax=Pararhizobium mangrovi TaxID=2590452 RepID=UPI001F447993|nr:DMT family transporter [Pararhizobium mangrovi]
MELTGVGWLVLDMTLVTSMNTMVKMAGGSFPSVQIVFVRALTGFVVIAPLVWARRAAIARTRHGARHIVRVSCNAAALTCNFTALATLPIALVTAIGFCRPLVAMGLAAALLGERVGKRRWIAAAIGLAGVLVAIYPAGGMVWSVGILAAMGAVVFGSMATIQTRLLRNEDTLTMMVFYTVGLTLFTAIPAGLSWQMPRWTDLAMLVAIGIVAQIAQLCFLRAYRLAPASKLAPIGYFTIVLSMIADYAFFDHTPTIRTVIGAAITILALRLSLSPAHRREA